MPSSYNPKTFDPQCYICQEPRSAHAPTEDGPLTCPPIVRGEGTFVLVRPGYTMSGCMGSAPGFDDIEIPPVYKFVPKEVKADG